MAGGRINALERRTGLSRDGTRAPTQGPEWPGRLWAAPLKSDSPILNLLRAKNGLDNRDHFRFLAKVQWILHLIERGRKVSGQNAARGNRRLLWGLSRIKG